MQSGYLTLFHGMNRGCVARAMLNRNANTAGGLGLNRGVSGDSRRGSRIVADLCADPVE
jgi:hypothetical protein